MPCSALPHDTRDAMTFAVLCPGQGAQHARMLDAALTRAEGRLAIDAASAVLGADVRAWCRDAEAMFANATAQPLLCVAQQAAWHAIRDALPVPQVVAGYSVGELAAYGIADALQTPELATLARARAQAMDAAAARRPGGLVAVRGLPRDEVDAACNRHGAAVAIVIDDDAYVIGAPRSSLQAVQDALVARGGHCTPLPVGVASHTPLLADAVPRFEQALRDSALADPRVPVVAGVDGTLATTRARAIASLVAQLTAPVLWTEVMSTLDERGCRVVLELGPGRALSRMISARVPDAHARSLDEFGSLDGAVAWVLRHAG
jgi:[acyl-carrier-protein] S-malonyltransferase